MPPSTNRHIANCVANQTRGPAYLLTDKSNSVLITGCRSFQIEDDAVRVDGSHELTIAGLIDSGNVNPGTQDLTTRFDDLPEPRYRTTGSGCPVRPATK